MKQILSPHLRRLALSLALCGIFVSTGCITRQVRQAISESEIASVSADYGLGNADPSGTKTGVGWQAASAKIETIIAQHPENPSMIAALRVRQAVMLLNNQQINLARAAFGEASLKDLHTSRDRALKELENELCWWYQTAKGTLATEEYRGASNTLAKITSVRAGLKTPGDDSMRDWLAALRAWIALKMANDADNSVLGAGTSQKWLEDALNTFASMLPQGETANWLNTPGFPAGLTPETAVTGSNRRRFYADDLIQGAKKAMRQNAIPQPNVIDDYFKAGLAR